MSGFDGEKKLKVRLLNGAVFLSLAVCIVVSVKRSVAQHTAPLHFLFLLLALIPGVWGAWLSGQALLNPERLERASSKQQIRNKRIGQIFVGIGLLVSGVAILGIASAFGLGHETTQSFRFVGMEFWILGTLLLERSGPYRHLRDAREPLST